MSDSLRPHELQHARPPCPSPTPGVYSNSRPSSWWCHPAISSSCPFLLLPPIREMQIKTTVRYHLTPITMTSTKATEISQCWQGRGQTGPPHTLTGVWKGQLPWDSGRRFIKRVKTELPYDPARPILHLYPKESKESQRNIYTLVSIYQHYSQ